MMFRPFAVALIALTLVPLASSAQAAIGLVEVSSDTQEQSGLDFTLLTAEDAANGSTRFTLILNRDQEALKDWSRTTLVVRSGDKTVVEATLSETPPTTRCGGTEFSFTVANDLLEGATLRLMIGQGGASANSHAYDLKLSTFVGEGTAKADGGC